jgi:catechol-2,3-dioxygenase
MGVKKLGHVGIWAKDMQSMKQFYAEMIGLAVTDEGPAMAFMSSHPDEEHHEFALFQANAAHPSTDVQQISFSCESLEDIVEYYQRFKAGGVQFNQIVSHGNAVGLYFFDPEGNNCEVYWTTPFKARQPFAVAVDLSQPVPEILSFVEQDARQFAETGHYDPESFKRQKEQFLRDGIKV